MKKDRRLLSFARDNRANQRHAERVLWYRLRDFQLEGFKFRRQHIIEPFIADFVCLDKKLIVELDGAHHHEDYEIEEDNNRTAYLERKGYKVIRFDNIQVIEDLSKVLRIILAELQAR